MTVSSQTSTVAYAGDGATTSYPIPFYFLESGHVQALLREDASGVETALAQPADFSVSGAGEPSGGTLAAAVAPGAGTTLLIHREVPATQETDYVENDPFPAESHERALDKLTMIAQQLGREIGRSFRLKLSDPTASIELPDVEMRKGKYLFFDPGSGAPSVSSSVTVGTLMVSAFWEGVLDENSAAASRALLEAAGTNEANVFTAAFQALRSTVGGAGAAPVLRLLRDSASPAADDWCGALSFEGRNDAAAPATIAALQAGWIGVSAGAENGRLAFHTIVDGAVSSQMELAAGLALAGAVDGHKGSGSINARAYYLDGQSLPFQKGFQSAPLNVVSNGAASAAHGLGAAPKLVQAAMRCVTAELGYAVGDEVVVDLTYGSSDARGANVVANATTVAVACQNLPYLASKGGGSGGYVTAARWRWILRAWA